MEGREWCRRLDKDRMERRWPRGRWRKRCVVERLRGLPPSDNWRSFKEIHVERQTDPTRPHRSLLSECQPFTLAYANGGGRDSDHPLMPTAGVATATTRLWYREGSRQRTLDYGTYGIQEPQFLRMGLESSCVWDSKVPACAGTPVPTALGIA